MAGGRSSGSFLLATTSLTAPVRASFHFSLLLAGRGKQKFISAHDSVGLFALKAPVRNSFVSLGGAVALKAPIRPSANYLLSAQSLNRAFYLDFLESNAEIFDNFRFEYELHAQPMPEHNPYRPRIPEQLIHIGDDYYDFTEENQQILREQHNITQAGDTTFPYQLVIQAHDNKLYKLGSIGRFYHEDYGVSLARYVQFESMTTVEVASCPVGLFKKAKSLEWKVTNDFSLSDPDLVVGVSAAYVTPKNDQYGWVLINGASLQPIKNTSTTAEIGESFAWSASGEINNTTAGKILGRRVNKLDTDSTAMLAGQMWIQLESMSVGSINAIFDTRIADISAALADLQDVIAGLPDAATIAAINAQVNLLKNQLLAEISARIQADVAIQDQIAALNTVSQTDLNNLAINMANNLASAVAAIQAQLDEIRAIALDALDKANQALSADLTAIWAQISAILTMLTTEIARPKGRFPIVDGSVPPNLVYTEDGSLVYLETF